MCREMAPRGETEKRRGGTREGARAGAQRVADGAGVRRRTAPARRHSQNREGGDGVRAKL